MRCEVWDRERKELMEKMKQVLMKKKKRGDWH